MKAKSKPIPLTRTEQKAAKTDSWVRKHLADIRNAHDLKHSQLRALRLARETDPKTPPDAEDD